MTPPQPCANKRLQSSEYWMRAISFAGLHRILNAVAAFPTGLRANEINKLAQETDMALTRRGTSPAPTTLYHYRNTLLHLCALKRHGRRLCVNEDDPEVRKLINQPPPATGHHSLSDPARDSFAALVLKNDHCRSLFFDLFMPPTACPDSVSSFRRDGVSVKWTRKRTSYGTEVVLLNKNTGRLAYLKSHASVIAILRNVSIEMRQLSLEFSEATDGIRWYSQVG